MKWFLYFPLNCITSIFCYLTNWLAVIFADQEGEMHGLWKYWQTWDDSVDVEWFVKETVPRFLRYDFDSHYISSREKPDCLARYNRDKGRVICINQNFTLKERLQRYCCRVLWLTRNCGYGFSFYLFGADHCGTLLHIVNTNRYRFVYGGDVIGAPWQLDMKIWRFQILAGWKLNTSSTVWTRSMIAGRIIFR